MEKTLLTEKNGRLLCWTLTIFDIFLGGITVFFPLLYSQVIHPELSDPPVDIIMRTGVLWLIFAFFQFMAATSKEPEKWFFAVGIIRLMEVPADILYGTLAIGATAFSRCLIFIAPISNAIMGIFLYKLSEKLKIERLKSIQ